MKQEAKETKVLSLEIIFRVENSFLDSWFLALLSKKHEPGRNQ
jgi:hypothetical protein